jgi:hypothetical protein
MESAMEFKSIWKLILGNNIGMKAEKLLLAASDTRDKYMETSVKDSRDISSTSPTGHGSAGHGRRTKFPRFSAMPSQAHVTDNTEYFKSLSVTNIIST